MDHDLQIFWMNHRKPAHWDACKESDFREPREEAPEDASPKEETESLPPGFLANNKIREMFEQPRIR